MPVLQSQYSRCCCVLGADPVFDYQMSSSNLPTKAWCLAGVAMLCSLRIGVMAFRSLNPARGNRRGGAMLSMTSSSGVAAAGQAPDLANLRENYVSTGIDEKALPSEPHVLMDKWVEAACNSKDVIDPNAMCLSTVGEGGKPSARFVLMKGFDKRGITWYTNYNSRKAKELKEFPYAAITFWWGALHRSVRFEGEVARVSEEESDEYFACRPTGSKIGAWVSDQSEPVGSRQELDAKAKGMELLYGDTARVDYDWRIPRMLSPPHLVLSGRGQVGQEAFASEGDKVPRPPHWGGFRLRPTRVEFWEGQPSRLHDRIVYSLDSDGTEGGEGSAETWSIKRLQP